MEKLEFNTGMSIEMLDKKDFYIDKTMIIDNLIKDNGTRINEVNLICRPRRFGKSVALETINLFFNPNKTEKAKEFFSDKKIAKTDKYKYLGTKPVIHLDFKNPDIYEYDDMIDEIRELFEIELLKYEKQIYELNNKRIIEIYESLRRHENTYVKKILKECISIVYEITGIKPIVLIDEYDSFVLETLTKDFSERVINFYRTFFGTALKNNPYLDFAVLVGVTELTKNSIFSAMNNTYVSNVLDTKEIPFYDKFGFSQEEIDPYIDMLGLQEKREEIKNYYDGYCIGGEYLYNPDSISKMFSMLAVNKEATLKEQWVNTGSNKSLQMILEKNFSTCELNDELLRLVNRDTSKIKIDKEFNVNNLTNKDSFYTYLLYAGYLTIKYMEEDFVGVVVPNREVQKALLGIATQMLEKGTDENYIRLKEAFTEMDTVSIEKEIKKIFKNVYYSDIKNHEKVYRNTLASLISLLNIYSVKVEKETSNGRLDIALISCRDNIKNYALIELKVAESEEQIEAKHKEAREQIKKRDYLSYFDDNIQDKVKTYTMVFNGCNVSMRECDIR